MEIYIAILRGINVGGHKVEMTGLKALFEVMKFKEVKTYIQSGNVVFKSAEKSPDEAMAKKIQKKIEGKYGFGVPVVIRSVEEMEKILAANPFLKEPGIDNEKLHVTFLAEEPGKERAEALAKIDYSPERFEVIGKEIYLYCPNGYGNAKLTNNFLEVKLKVVTTTRNWKTVNKLAEMGRG